MLAVILLAIVSILIGTLGVFALIKSLLVERRVGFTDVVTYLACGLFLMMIAVSGVWVLSTLIGSLLR